jgi:hypothetical protein
MPPTKKARALLAQKPSELVSQRRSGSALGDLSGSMVLFTNFGSAKTTTATGDDYLWRVHASNQKLATTRTAKAVSSDSVFPTPKTDQHHAEHQQNQYHRQNLG